MINLLKLLFPINYYTYNTWPIFKYRFSNLFFLENEASYEQTLFYVFDLLFHLESHPLSDCIMITETPYT